MPATAQFLVVDDDQEVCNFFTYLLKSKGYRVETANTGREAFAKLNDYHFDAALVDLKLPDSDGIAILKQIKKQQPECEVIIITGYSTVKSAIEAIQHGAFDYVEKPFVNIEEMEKLIEKALSVRAQPPESIIEEAGLTFIVGSNPKMRRLVVAAQKIAKKNITVLIQGETGSGKEVLARYIHAISHRSDRPFLACNCGAFSETLLESELFGHEKGSFTGATSRKKGIFELAHKGTLFLDEIDSASPAIQVKLLRVLETGEFLRVGGETICKVDMRVIAATNANLASKVEESYFREDLFYRLDVASLVIPPLRERIEDIPLFLNHYLEAESKIKNIPVKRFSDEALAVLKEHSWPGNIRELKNTVSQALLLSSGPLITVADLPERVRPKKTTPVTKEIQTALEDKKQNEDAKPAAVVEPVPVSDERLSIPQKIKLQQQQIDLLKILAQFEEKFLETLRIEEGFDFNGFYESFKNWSSELNKKIIQKALEETYGNQVKAAELLNITPRALRYHLKK
ncbi:MAG: sigma-54-dependent Fis family transcriptional regulator [Firmicutes bacterium]|nr:sigma-54-dependent Fis family transcriptional regulator [Bacillota bacterium]